MNGSIHSCIFITELLVAEGLYLFMAPKRSHFWWRLIPSILVCMLAGYYYPMFHADSLALRALVNFLHFFLLFVLTCVCALFCFKGKPSAIIALCSAGYATQHCTQRIYAILTRVIPMFPTLPYEWRSVLQALVCFPIPYFLLWLIFARAAKKDNYLEETDGKIHIISIGIVILCMGVSRISDFNLEKNLISIIAESTYAVVCAFMILLIQFYFFHYEQKKREISTLNELLKKEQMEFLQWKENLDFINVKCHDLKQSISALRVNYSEESIKDIEDAVIIYNNGVKTGNEILDALFYEKGSYCEKNGIAFSYMIDGAKLSGFKDLDMFSLFSNIIINAIEGVERIEDQNKRAINLSVKGYQNTIIIHEENFCAAPLVWKDGLPITSKSDKSSHGFGLRSIQMTAQRLSGTFVCKEENGVFTLTVTLPIISA